LSSARRDASSLEINAQKSRAEKTSARNVAIGQEQVSQTEAAINEAAALVERIVPVRIELPATGLQRGHRLLDATQISCSYGQRTLFGPLDISITGPERIALTGANGSGKSTLLKVISGALSPIAGTVRNRPDRAAVLDQHLSLLSPDEDALAAMQRLNPALNKHEAHAALAQYGFRADWCERMVASLSGGERVRLALACLFSGPTPPQLLLLDEPTNHLDIYAIEMLEEALCGYDGAIVCVSHDAEFRSALKLEKTVDLGIGIPLNTPAKE
jgi:ATPase subunit of ABC transporter with duplicated ATPase domains